MKRISVRILAFVLTTVFASTGFAIGGSSGPSTDSVIVRGAATIVSARDAEVEAESQGTFITSVEDPLNSGLGGFLEGEFLFNENFGIGLRLQLQTWNSEDFEDAEAADSLMFYADIIVRGRLSAGGGLAFTLTVPVGVSALAPSQDLSDDGWEPGGGFNSGLYGGVEQTLTSGFGLFFEAGFHVNRYTLEYTGPITDGLTVDFNYFDVMLGAQAGVFLYF